MRRVGLILAVVVVGSLIAVTVAIASGTRSPLAQPTEAPKPAAALAYDPAPGATGVNPTAPIGVGVSSGSFAEVALRDAQGAAVEGTLSDDHTHWTASQPLHYAQTYTWSGTATGENGTAVPLEGTFRTVEPQTLVRGLINIGDGRTVGIAAPIEIQFDHHVADRAAVERALKIETSRSVEGAWGWLPGRERWLAHPLPDQGVLAVGHEGDGHREAVRRRLRRRCVRPGGRVVLLHDRRAQIVKADANSHRLVVMRDGKKVADYPASYGLASDPERNTRSGVHVVSEKFTDKRMVSQQFDYDLVEKWAVRMSNNGEFIHANPARRACRGRATSPTAASTCRSTTPRPTTTRAIYGDPVEVTGTPVKLAARDGDIWDWTLSWDQWTALSALS